MLMEEEGRCLYISEAKGLDKNIIERTTLSLGEGIAGWVAKERKPLIVDERVDIPQIKSRLNRGELTSALVSPVKLKEKTLGVINLGIKESGRKFTQNNLNELINLVDDFLSGVIVFERRKRKLYNEIKTKEELLRWIEKINTSSRWEQIPILLIEWASSFTKADYLTFAFMDGDSKEFNRFGEEGFPDNVFEEISTFILKEKKPVILEDLEREKYPLEASRRIGLKSLLSFPFEHEEIIGFFGCGFLNPRKFSVEKEVSLIKSIVQFASITLNYMLSIQKLKKEVIIDGLTRLYNWTYGKRRLREEIERAKRQNSPLSVVMADIDKFKAYNDKYGHIEGDKVLKNVAKVISSKVRTTDIPVRYGGDEFLLIFPFTSLEQIKKTMQRINRTLTSLQESRKRTKDISPYLTLSSGVAEFPVDGDTEEALIKAADKALYFSKETGGKKMSVFNSIAKKDKSC